MNIMLINPHSFWKGEVVNLRSRSYNDNLSIRYLASSLEEAGYQVDMLDGHFEELDISELMTKIERGPNYDVYGISCTEGILEETFMTAACIKKKNAKSIVFIGGYAATFLGVKILQNNLNIDFALCGEGEYSIIKLMQNIQDRLKWRDIKGLMYRDETGIIYKNPFHEAIEDLDALPWPKREGIYHGKANMLASRGCYGMCQYCSITEFHRLNHDIKFRYRSARDIVDEMEYLHYNLNISYFDFVDDSFMTICKIDPTWVNIFSDELNKRNMGITWGIQSRAVDVSYDIFKTMHKVGLRFVSIGIENNSKRVIKLLKTGTNYRIHKSAIKIIQALNINYYLEMILLEPTSNLYEIEENLNFLEEINYCNSPIQQPITFSTCLKIYTGTPVEDIYEGIVPYKYSTYHIDYEYLHQEINVLKQCLINWQKINSDICAMHLSHPHFLASQKKMLGLGMKAVKLQKEYLRFDMDVYKKMVVYLKKNLFANVDDVMCSIRDSITEANEFNERYKQIFEIVYSDT